MQSIRQRSAGSEAKSSKLTSLSEESLDRGQVAGDWFSIFSFRSIFSFIDKVHCWQRWVSSLPGRSFWLNEIAREYLGNSRKIWQKIVLINIFTEKREILEFSRKFWTTLLENILDAVSASISTILTTPSPFTRRLVELCCLFMPGRSRLSRTLNQ